MAKKARQHPRYGLPDPVLRLAVITLNDEKKARAQYLNTYGLEKLDDDAICDAFDREVEHAICAEQPRVELPIEIAESLVVILKSRKRSRGRSRRARHDKIAFDAAIETARRRKAELVKNGRQTADAYVIASNEASRLLRDMGINVAAETIQDRMKRRTRSGKK